MDFRRGKNNTTDLAVLGNAEPHYGTFTRRRIAQ